MIYKRKPKNKADKVKKKSIYDQLLSFIDISQKKMFGNNAWISNDKMRVYIRKASHIIEGEMLQCLDIASVEVDEAFRRKGHFKRFLRYAMRVNPWDVVYIENVQNPILREYLQQEKWVETDIFECDGHYVSHFYKRIENK